MSNSRPFIILTLEEAFKNPQKAKELHDKTLQTLTESPGNASRIFDKFPCLLPEETIQDISKKCLNVLSDMKVDSITFDPNGIHVHNKNDQYNIAFFIKEIVSIAITELLDNQGHIKKELIELLGWQDIQDQLNQPELIISILCGYIGAINQEIVTHFSEEILNLNSAYTGFTGYLNKKVPNKDHHETHVRQWIIDKLNESGYVFDTTVQKYQNNLLSWRSNPISNANSLRVASAIHEASALMFFKPKPLNNPYLKIDGMKKNPAGLGIRH